MLSLLAARPRGINSSLMLWRAGHHCRLFACLLETYAAVTTCTHKFDHFLEMMLHQHMWFAAPNRDTGDPCGEGDKYCYYLQDVAPGKISDYSSLLLLLVEVEDENEAPQGTVEIEDVVGECAIVCFPLQPKPHQVSSSWMRRHWGDEENKSS
jgi:hypothetical protein